MALVRRGIKLLQNSLSRKPKILLFPSRCRFFTADLSSWLARFSAGLGLLCFNGFAFPASGHRVIIVPCFCT